MDYMGYFNSLTTYISIGNDNGEVCLLTQVEKMRAKLANLNVRYPFQATPSPTCAGATIRSKVY